MQLFLLVFLLFFSISFFFFIIHFRITCITCRTYFRNRKICHAWDANEYLASSYDRECRELPSSLAKSIVENLLGLSRKDAVKIHTFKNQRFFNALGKKIGNYLGKMFKSSSSFIFLQNCISRHSQANYRLFTTLGKVLTVSGMYI